MRIIAIVLLLGLSACSGISTWKTVYSSVSPDRKESIRVEETNCFSDCTVRVVVSNGQETKTIAKKLDCAVFFAHAAWSGSLVAVFVDGVYCGDIRIAYDLASNRALDFRVAQGWLGEAIIREYAITPDELRANGDDVFKWATYPGHCCSRAVDEFRKRFPM